MKRKNIIVSLALTLTLGLGATAFAAGSNSNNSNTAPVQRLNMGRIAGLRGYEIVSNILKEKLGFTDNDIKDAGSSGKSLYDLAQEKGMSAEQFKEAVVEARNKAVDEAVKKGTLSKEDSAKLKERIKENSQNCQGNFGAMSGGRGGNGQQRGVGRGNGNCCLQGNTSNKQ